ncbi:6-phosphogluconolactonase [Enemella sp. A6]|uniref:6-phosphogluconolactonase n=1 Tax=Enemella sp. A6 TaxID=3440152 RepID=UPI003EB7D88B
MTVEILLHNSADHVVEQVAGTLLDTLAQLQSSGKAPQLCMTGGRVANRIYARVAELAPDHALDWSNMDLWWGDERFVPTDDPDRNVGQALATLAGRLQLSPSRIHSMPAADGPADLDAAARTYADDLGNTVFDICLLGMGPDGHVASLFPDHPSSEPTSRSVIAVRNSPKPPPERLSLTLPVINASTEVWLLVTGADKAEAVARAHRGEDIPAAKVHGTALTRWFLDADAGSML